MAMSSTAKLGISVGLGFASTTLTDAAIRYWAQRYPDEEPAAGEDKEYNWYYEYSSLIGGVVSLATAGVLWKTMGKEEALVCALAGVATALIVPIRTAVDETRLEQGVDDPERLERLHRLARLRALRGGRALGGRTVQAMCNLRQPAVAVAR